MMRRVMTFMMRVAPMIFALGFVLVMLAVVIIVVLVRTFGVLGHFDI